ncbi:hypothetical protein IWW38_003600, partial [Coemansia aciculifera]
PVVFAHIHHPVPQQDRPLYKKDQDCATWRLLPRVHWRHRDEAGYALHSVEVFASQPRQPPALSTHHPGHRHVQHPPRVCRCARNLTTECPARKRNII